MITRHAICLFRKAGLCLLMLSMVLNTLSQSALTPAGRLKVSLSSPYYFQDSGRHVVLVGVSDRDALTLWENDKGFAWRTYLDQMAAHRLNYVRQDVFSWGALMAGVNYPGQFTKPARVFRRIGPEKAVDGLPRFDLTQFDQSYFDQRLKPFLEAARQRGIYVELTLFEGFRKTSAFAESLYNDGNNVNRLGIGPRIPTSDAALNHAQLLSIQEAYVDKVLAETASFGNVIYEIANETGGRNWVTHFVDYIHHHPRHASQLVSAGEQTSAFDPRSGDNDIVVKHRGGGGPYATNGDILRHHNALLQFRVGRPVLHNEYFLYANRSTDDVHFPRKMMWADFLAGGHSNFYDFAHWRGTGRTREEGRDSQAPPREILEGGRHLLAFIEENKVPFWNMAPHDELIRIVGQDAGQGEASVHVFTLAWLGTEYLSYVLGEGRTTLAMELGRGTFVARWFDPKTGEWVGMEETIQGGGEQRIDAPPFEQDIVLHLRKWKQAGMSAVPQTFSLPEQ